MADKKKPADLSVFERLANRFSECQEKISRGKIDSYNMEDLEHDIAETMREAARAFFQEIALKDVLEDAPYWFHKLPRKAGDNNKGVFWIQYWVYIMAWFAGRGGISCPLEVSPFLHYISKIFRSERYRNISFEQFIQSGLRLVGDPVHYFEYEPGDRSHPWRNEIKAFGCGLAELSEDVCSYLAHILASKPEPAEKERSKPFGKLGWIKAFLWKLYDMTVKSVLEWLWTKIFSGHT